MGVGTEKKGIIGFNPITCEKRMMCDDYERTRSSAYIHKGKDGSVYGHLDSEDVGFGFTAEDLSTKKNWLVLKNGLAEPVTPDSVSLCHYYNRKHSFEGIHSPFIDASFIKEYNISHHEVVYIDPMTNKRVTIKLNYKTEGAGLSPMVAGPDGKLYGTSNHPMHGYCFDPRTSRITNYGGKFYEEAGGGDICAYAVQGSVIGGAAYYGGKIHIFDTSKPINIDGENGQLRNPKLVAVHKEIIRPRSAAAHIDKETFIFGGFGENGGTGGGLCIYNYRTGEDTVIPNENILKYHSTLCMRVLQDGNLIAGTSTASPCGGTLKVKEAELYIMDWETCKVIYRCISIPSCPEVSLMQIDASGLVHCIASGPAYFVFDPSLKEVIYLRDLKGFGPVVRDGLVKGENGILYGLFENAIYSIDTKNFIVEKLAKPPVKISIGMAYLDDKIYFGGASKESIANKINSGARESHLWSFSL